MSSNSHLTREQVKDLQTALSERNLRGANDKPLTVDGDFGINTGFAVITYKKQVGLAARDYVGPITFKMLTGKTLPMAVPASDGSAPPWYNEMLRMIGKHETYNKAEVEAWLKSDGKGLDPEDTPWCGDGVQTALALSGFRDGIPAKPFAAVNWVPYGIPTTPRLGAIMVNHRGDPKDWRGHIGFYAGESLAYYYFLGANQGNRISIAPMSKRLLRKDGCRWPKDGPDPALFGKITMSGGTTVSVT